MGNAAAGGEGGGEEDLGGKYPAKGRCRDMSLPQLARYQGEGGEKAHAYVALRGEIFDVSNALEKEDVRSTHGAWFGKNKEDASDDEIEAFRGKYCKLGDVIKQRVISPEELATATGEAGAPIYIAARGLVFDVTSGESFYGPGGGYHLFAGHNAQRALALMSLKPEDVVNTSLDGLDPKDLKILDDWIDKYYLKYPLIGTLSDAGARDEKAKEDDQAEGQQGDDDKDSKAVKGKEEEGEEEDQDKAKEETTLDDAAEEPPKDGSDVA